MKRQVRLAMAVAVALLASGCAGMRIHDAGRAEQAAAVKKDYDEAKVTEAADADRKNLELLLAEEIKVIRDNHALQVDIALLSLANDSSPATSRVVEARGRLAELGFDSLSGLRTYLQDGRIAAASSNTLNTITQTFRAMGLTPPICTNVEQRLLQPSSANEKTVLELFKKECREIAAASQPKNTGLLNAAKTEWETAATQFQQKQSQRQKAEQDLREAAAAHGRTAKDLAARNVVGAERTERLKEQADKLADLLSKVKREVPGAEGDQTIDALVDLLSAAAGDEVDPDNPDVARAAIVAGKIPALAGDIASLRERRSAPSISGLLMALRQQTLAADVARQRVALAEERVAILKARYDGLKDEALRWLRFVDAACSQAVLGAKANAEHPGTQCNDFVADEKGNCMLKTAAIDPCVLKQPWRDRLRDRTAPAAAQRELNKAIAAYLQALALQAVPQEQRFREIDVRHRETLLAKRAALASWDNLVGVPIDQLDAFYMTGLKPAEIADLIVKALGFTAVAIGVSK